MCGMEDKVASDRRLWLISEVYYPQETATGYYMTGLAEGLAGDFVVHALCAQPPAAPDGDPVPTAEMRNGVRIERCRGTRLNKDVVALRLVNLATISAAIFFRALRRLRRGDVALVVTNPPLLPFVVVAACRLRGARCVLRIDDVYPEVMVATGLTGPTSAVTRAVAAATRWLYRHVDHIVVLGRDMAELATRKLGSARTPVMVIPNWADVDLVMPVAKADSPLARELGLTAKFVVQCAGNMGRAQGIETVFKAAEMLRGHADLHFLFIGTGAKRPWMEREVRDKSLANVTLLDQRPRADQADFLNACDVAVIPLVPGMFGAGVPSRAYNVMAAGKPIIAVADPASEVSLVVAGEELGWVVAPGAAAALVQAILAARADPTSLHAMGVRARAAAEARYSRACIVDRYRNLVLSLLS